MESVATGGAPDRAADGHLVRFYRGERSLADPVASYAAEGLQGGAAVLLITTEAHGAAINAALAAQSIDLAAATLSGQLQILGARPLLAGIMLGGLPDEQLFRELVGAPLERARGRFGRLRVYGEMVDLLWAEGNRRAALRMEELWNDLLRERGIPLLCAYQLEGFRDEADAAHFAEVCRAHARVIPPGDAATGDGGDEALRRRLARLEQKALALETEVARRRELQARIVETAQREVARREEFLNIAAHELKTPLTALQLGVQGLVRMMEKGEPITGDAARARLGRVGASASRLTSLIDMLLDASRVGSGQLSIDRSPTDFSALVREVAGRFEELARKAGAPVRLCVAEAVLGSWDRQRLDQILSNLMSNALKYGGGSPVDISLALEGSAAVLRVGDHGPGIAPEDQERIFERFERVVSARQVSGLGLGLWIARELTRAHGGHLCVASAPGQGATFTAVLPQA